MTAKHLSAASCFFMGITALPAQAPALAFQKAGVSESNLYGLVSQLAQNAHIILWSIALLMGIAWLFCIWNACFGQNPRTFPAAR